MKTNAMPDQPRVVLLRVGVDSGEGGIQGPLLENGAFDFVPIPDTWNRHNIVLYGNTQGRHGRNLCEYWPGKRKESYRTHPIHFDPEFKTFTYGDPTRPKQSLRFLRRGDLLVFYAGLQPWSPKRGFYGDPQLYIIGYFVVKYAGRIGDIFAIHTRRSVEADFRNCHHVALDSNYRKRERLILVKGARESRLLGKATLLSEYSKDRNGKRIKVLRGVLKHRFGKLSARNYLQRSPPRWVPDAFCRKAYSFVTGLK